MPSSSLLAVSPLDGRYASRIQNLVPYFSEFGLIRYRVHVEIEYLIRLSSLNLKNCPPLPESAVSVLRDWVKDFTPADAEVVKGIEKKINHDVKAVEYWIKEKLEGQGLENWKEFVHFGLTSQDINNTAIPLSIRENYERVIRPDLIGIMEVLLDLGNKWLDVPMLARTHGQPATPTRFGKEILVFAERIERQILLLDQVPFMAKFGGATGGFNAHHVAYPETDWVGFGNFFIASLGLERAQFTTQIEHYDCLAAFFDGLARLNTILIDFSRDVWQYISLEYLKQKINAGEVGSSAMPHKVNPIDFENAEGNFGIANALFSHFSAKLPVSRLQRDLSDSTVLRNIGVPLGHCLVAYNSLQRGLAKVELNEAALLKDLDLHPEVVSEAIQTVLRREGFPEPYEALKKLSRVAGQMRMEDIHEFINHLEIDPEVKAELLKISPRNYIGIHP
jgi:adenylosuccinate lyase